MGYRNLADQSNTVTPSYSRSVVKSLSMPDAVKDSTHHTVERRFYQAADLRKSLSSTFSNRLGLLLGLRLHSIAVH